MIEQRGRERGTGIMKSAAWLSAAAFALMMCSLGGSAEAAYCGADSYDCCPVETCGCWGRFGTAKRRCCPKYQTVKKVVWDQQEYCCPVTVYDTCCERVPVPCTRTIYKTCYRKERYTVCRPVYKTHYKTVCKTIRKPVYKTHYKTVTCKVRKPVYKTCYRDHCYTVCRPVTKTCYRTVCQTVCRPVYKTHYKTVCCTRYRTKTRTCYKNVCYTVCKPVRETRWVDVCVGHWKIVRERVPACCSMTKCGHLPHHMGACGSIDCCEDECCDDGCCDDGCPDCRCMEKTHCCVIARKVWCPKVVKKKVTC